MEKRDYITIAMMLLIMLFIMFIPVGIIVSHYDNELGALIESIGIYGMMISIPIIFLVMHLIYDVIE